jgi:hypothetical protein
MKLSKGQFYVLIALGAVGAYLASKQFGELLNAINPVNQDNVFYGGASSVTQKLAGRDLDKFGKPLTFGAWLAGGLDE